MKKGIITYCICFISLSLGAQSWIDSIAAFPNDSMRFSYLDKQASKYFYADIKTAIPIVNLYDSLSQISTDPFIKGNAIVLKGNIQYVQGQHTDAIPLYIQAVTLLELHDTSPQLAKAYNNLATCYQVRNDTENSTKYFLKSLEIYKFFNDTLWMANVNANLGLQFLNDGILDKSERYLNEAIKRYEQIENQIFKGITLLSRGNLRIEQKKFKEAIKDYNLSKALVPAQVSPLAQAACQAGLGTAYNRLGQHQTALPYLLRSLNQAKEIQQTEQIRESNRELATLYKATKNYKQALDHFEAYAEAKDTTFTIEQDAELANALTKYESEKKENEIALLNSQNELQSTRLKARRIQLMLLGIGSLFLIGLVAGLSKLYQKVNKQNAVIGTALEEKDTLLREIHHRVKNNLQVISALLTLQSKHVKDDIALEALQEGQGRVQSMALIHQDLYQHDNLKGVNTKDYFEKLIESLIDTYKTEERNIELECDIEQMMLDVDTMIPLGLVVNELTSNALKHAFANKTGGKIKITLLENNDQLHLSVQDNGHGAKSLDLENKSFGFSLIKSFARRLDAELKIENDNGLQVALLINNYQKAA